MRRKKLLHDDARAFQLEAFAFDSLPASQALASWLGHHLSISRPLQFPVRDAPGLIDRWEFVRMVTGDAVKTLKEDMEVGWIGIIVLGQGGNHDAIRIPEIC